jgi:Eco57I restriction-modification methylase/TaqI-like C-terminal specificity domain
VTDSTDLKLFLRQDYSRQAWKGQLEKLFGNVHTEFFRDEAVADLPNPDSERVAAMRHFGYVDLGEPTFFGTQHRLAVVEVELKPSTTDIARNRIGLRALTYPFVDGIRAHGVLTFYFDPTQADYRLSFQTRLAKARSDGALPTLTGTDRRRYTFVLGRHEAATTAAARLSELGRKAGHSKLEDVLEAFSVEKLSRDFFETYKKFYYEFAEHLGANYRPVFGLPTKRPGTKEKREAEEKPVRDYAKRLLGRLVFLHFLQKKGWMGCAADRSDWTGGDPEFIQSVFNAFTDKPHFHSRCLVPLFFNTLNAPRPNDALHIAGLPLTCRVPYLNGGLFELDEDEKVPIDFPADLFGRLLRFFAEYNFTIEENRPDDHDVGIDPEMLGHIFENLLEENRSKGAIYTPRAIVQYMCQESLIAYLTTHLAEAGVGREPVAAFVRAPHDGLPEMLRQRADTLDHLLEDVRVCDPAIGSGAFPIGVLQELFALRLYLYPHLRRDRLRGFNPADVKRHIIERNVYGVDIDRGAVDIARLRFWLALVVDEEEPLPLPNLDYKVMHGNSLLESFRGMELHHLRPLHRVVREVDADTLFGAAPTVAEPANAYTQQWEANLEQLLAFLFVAGNEREVKRLLRTYPEAQELARLTKSELRQRIEIHATDRFEYEINVSVAEAGWLLAKAERERAEKQMYVRLDERDSKSQRRSKLNSLAALDEKVRKAEEQVAEFAEAAAELRKLRGLSQGARRNVATGEPLPDPYYFLWHIYFREVFEKNGGFDIVIANPPYMRVQEVTQSQRVVKAEYRRAYDLIANGAYDLANLFVLKALGDPGNDKSPAVAALLNLTGVGCFILPHKFFNAAGSEDFRTVLLERNYLSRVVHFGANRVFHGVDTYVAISLFSRRPTAGAFQLQRIPYPTLDFTPYLTDDRYFAAVPYESLEAAINCYGSNQLILLASPEEYALFQQLYRRKILTDDQPDHAPATLGELLDIFVGLQTSHDKLYVLHTDPKRETDTEYVGRTQLDDREWKVEKKWFRPMLRGRDVHRYEQLETDNVVFFPYEIKQKRNPKTGLLEPKPEAVPLKTLEKKYKGTEAYVKAYIDEFKEREGGKSAGWDEWYEYLYPKNLARLGTEGLSSMEICSIYPNVTLNDGSFYHNTKVYSWVKKTDAPESYKYLLALANSRVLWWFLKRTGDTLQGDARTLKTNYLNPFPLPPTPTADETEALEKLVHYQLWLHNPAYRQAVDGLTNTAVAQYFQQVLDLCVCELYMRQHLEELEVNILPYVVAQLPPLTTNPPETEQGAIAHVYRRWQAPDSIIRQRLQMAPLRSPQWLGAIFSA